MALPVACAAILQLAACGGSDRDAGPGDATVGEERAIEEAAEMLGEQRLPQKPEPGPSATGDAPAPAGE